MKKSTLIVIGIVLVMLSIIAFIVFKNSNTPKTSSQDDSGSSLDLPINTIPVEERPFITLSPDSTGRSLDLLVSGAPQEGELEYELVYQTVEVQEGIFGRLELDSEKQPITKSLLLGSKSAGGKVTYHEGVKSGSITVTYGTTRLKESFNYMSFDPMDPTFLSTDGRFVATLDKSALKKDTRVLTMKTFGYPKLGLSSDSKVIAGPYSIAYASEPKGDIEVELKLPAGEHINPTIYGWDGETWTKLTTKLSDDSVVTTISAKAFIVMGD